MADLTPLNPAGEWDRLTVYSRGDLVTHRESSWIALTDNIGSEPVFYSAVWQLLAAKGDPGDPLHPRGQWDRRTIYEPRDVVDWDGESWIAIRSSIGVVPVEGLDWMILARRGAPGSGGTQGSQGIQGIQGSTGPEAPVSIGPGAAFSLSADLTITKDVFTVVIWDVTDWNDSAFTLNLDGTITALIDMDRVQLEANIHFLPPTIGADGTRRAVRLYRTRGITTDYIAASDSIPTAQPPLDHEAYSHVSFISEVQIGDIFWVEVFHDAANDIDIHQPHSHLRIQSYSGAANINVEEAGVALGAADTLDFDHGLDVNNVGGVATVDVDESELDHDLLGNVTPNQHHAQTHTVADHTTSVTIRDEGVDQGAVSIVDFVGAGITATVAAGVGTITITASGASDESFMFSWMGY